MATRFARPVTASLLARPPSRAAQSARLTSLYIGAAGASVLASPVRLPALVFGAAAPPALWARVGGCVAVTFGAYYGAVYAADAAASAPGRGSSAVAVAFYRATVWVRIILAAALAALAAAHAAPGVGLLAAANAVGGAAMAFALAKDGEKVFV